MIKSRIEWMKTMTYIQRRRMNATRAAAWQSACVLSRALQLFLSDSDDGDGEVIQGRSSERASLCPVSCFYSQTSPMARSNDQTDHSPALSLSVCVCVCVCARVCVCVRALAQVSPCASVTSRWPEWKRCHGYSSGVLRLSHHHEFRPTDKAQIMSQILFLSFTMVWSLTL